MTALIAPNDLFARRVLAQLRQERVHFPRDLSLLSFDNHSIHPWEVDSVDLGFGNLGYGAFQILYGDLPIAAHKESGLNAKPFVTFRGTVFTPRSGPLSVRSS